MEPLPDSCCSVGVQDRSCSGITARAMGIDYDGEGSRWSRKVLFTGMVLLPMVFGLSMIWAWFHRTKVLAKLNSGIVGDLHAMLRGRGGWIRSVRMVRTQKGISWHGRHVRSPAS